ncbi:hypothetical protein C8R46DRAFT_1119459 [Mycena filopes]|nr:hypothetical protein C8R46DRAFT_1119459 [Mycena filopes]
MMNTPFQNILRTNVVPSEEDCQRIHQLLAGSRQEVLKLSNEIQRLQTLITGLAQKRDELNAFIDDHVALVSPARRLPDDVVAEVFRATLPSHHNSIMSKEESPLLLCQVSQAWRALAVSTPRLWTSMHVVAPPTASRLHQLNNTVELWLSRSGILPLSISFIRSQISDLDVSALLETLVRHSPRWKRIRLKVWTYASLRPFATISATDVPILEQITIEGTPEPGRRTDSSFISFLETSTLRSLSLRSFSFPLPFIPSPQIRHLSLGRNPSSYVGEAETLELFRSCPQLETCTLPFTPTQRSPPIMGPCRMEYLQHLSVLDAWQSTTNLFKILDLPNLQSLEYDAGNVEIFPFLPLLASTPNLRRLALKVSRVSPEAVIECLRLVPALTELFVCYDPFSFRGPVGFGAPPPTLDDTFWAVMTPMASNFDTVLCPNLRTVNFRKFRGLSDTALLEFIWARTENARFAGSTRLLKVHAQFNRPMQVDIGPELQRALANGLDLVLEYEAAPYIVYSPSLDSLAHVADGELLSDHWH